MWCRDAFRTNCLFHLRQVKEHLLADLGSRSLAATGKRLGRAPVEQPVIRAEGPERELGRAERCLNQARVADRAQMPVIVFDFDAVGGQGYGLILDLRPGSGAGTRVLGNRFAIPKRSNWSAW
jgi:hypothetical protein